MKKKVLFLCIGNSCRSPMAEGFARCYGTDVMEVESAGLAPANIIQPLTKLVMQEKNISLEGLFPKDLGSVDVRSFDVIVNMSGNKLPDSLRMEVLDWKVEDPIGRSEAVYVSVRNQIERLVMDLILRFRKEARKDQPRVPARRLLGRTGTRVR